jgi:hypothetical protein
MSHQLPTASCNLACLSSSVWLFTRAAHDLKKWKNLCGELQDVDQGNYVVVKHL